MATGLGVVVEESTMKKLAQEGVGLQSQRM